METSRSETDEQSAQYFNGYYRSGLKIEFFDHSVTETGTTTFHQDEKRIVDDFKGTNGRQYSIIYEHDETGLLETRTVKGGSGQVRDAQYVFLYDDNGDLYRRNCQDLMKSAQECGVVTYKLDENGQIVERVSVDVSQVRQKRTFTYDVTGNLIKRVKYDYSGKPYEQSTYNYSKTDRTIANRHLFTHSIYP